MPGRADPANARYVLGLLDRAIDWQTFTAAIDRFDTPSQNTVYADVDGNIGY